MEQQLEFWPSPRPAPALRWSCSRAQRLQICARQYYLMYLASAGGGDKAAPPWLQEVRRLKRLRNRFMWTGEIVHEVINRALACGPPWSASQQQALQQHGLERMQQQHLRSQQRRRQPAGGQLAHAFDAAIPAAEWEALRQRLQRCLHHFFTLPALQPLLRRPRSGWLAQETLARFDVDGTTVVVKPDFVVRTAADGIAVVDWKSGRPGGDADLQLQIYGLWASQRFGVPAAALDGLLVYLDAGALQRVPLGEAQLRDAAATIRATAARMQAIAAAPPVPTGGAVDPLTLPAAFDGPLAAHVPPTDERSHCRRCAFMRLCRRG